MTRSLVLGGDNHFFWELLLGNITRGDWWQSIRSNGCAIVLLLVFLLVSNQTRGSHPVVLGRVGLMLILVLGHLGNNIRIVSLAFHFNRL